MMMTLISATAGCRSARPVANAGFWLAAFFVLAVSVPAYAGIGIGIAPTYPSVVNAGDTNVPVNLTITNTSTPPENGGSITLSNIRHTPSCKSDTFPCLVADADPAVFQVLGPATGAAGTGCAGKNFNISSPDPTTGEVMFTATVPPVQIQAPNATDNLDTCVINFFVNVLKVPTKDALPTAGVQTKQPSGVHAQSDIVTASSDPTGSGLVTVMPQIIRIPSPALGGWSLMLVALLLLGVGVARRSRKAATAPTSPLAG